MAVTVETKRRTVLEPSPESARGGGKKVPLTVFDLASPDGYIPAAFAWFAPAPTNGKLKEGLLAAIARFPHLAGRFTIDEHGRKCIHLNDAGVLVLEATADADLADALAADDVSVHINQLYPKAHKEHAGEPIFQVQLTRYKCGGLVIGTACHHQVADGQAMNIFYTAWATGVRTHLVVLPSPFIDRSASVVPRPVPTPVFDHGNIEFKGEGTSRGVLPMESIKNLVVHFPGEFVAELKARVGTGCTTFQCLLAHAWKKVTAARGLSPDDISHVRVAVNCRGRAKPPMPMDFFGNMVLWAFPRMQVSDLLSSSYLAVVGVVRDAVAAVDDDYIHSFVDFGEVDRRGIGVELASTTPTPGMALSPHLEVDSWLGLRFNDLNFGFGPPSAVFPPDLPIEGLMIFVPSCAVKGGVDLFMALDEKHVKAFKQICYSIE